MSIRKGLRYFSERNRQGDHLLTLLTILLMLMMFVVSPLQAAGLYALDFPAGLIAIAMIAGVILLSANLVASVLMLVAFSINLWIIVLRLTGSPSSPVHILIAAAAWLILAMALGWPVARAVFAPGRVSYHRIIGAILLYLLIALVFVSLYTFVGVLLPNAFSGMTFEDSPTLANTMIYFSVVTLTTVGYGDILPVHPIARSLCNLESIIGQFYTATLLARLVTLHSESGR